MTITVVGGGLAGLIAAIECAERGEDVELFEAQSQLGGRARSAVGAYVANHGPHVVYLGPLWSWLDERGLAKPARSAPLNPNGVRFRHGGRSRRLPPRDLVRALRLLRREAPNDMSFREWVARETDEDAATVLSSACHVFSFHHDPGSLAADFVLERLKRAVKLPPQVRYIVGGWSDLVRRLETRARALGVQVTTAARVDEVVSRPTIVAVELRAARALLGDETLRWTGARTALLDVGLRGRRGDPFVVIDLDDGVFAERYTAPDRTLAPAGHQLVQLQVGLREDESLDDGVGQMEGVLDATFQGWREREVWRRRQVVADASGAVDLPGTTWRDRPGIDRGDGVFLCGDMVAAPGLLSEVSVRSAIEAAGLATSWRAATGQRRSGSRPPSTVA